MKQLLTIILLSFSIITQAQQIDEKEYEFYHKNPSYIGFGFGMDFGGIGGKLEYNFVDYTGIFLGLGYNFNWLGVNGGVLIKPLPKRQVTPYFLGMYGYTATVKIEGASQFNRTDYGFSLGAGIEIKTKNLNAWQIGAILPFRSKGFNAYYQELLDNPYVSLSGELPPVGFSIGFKILIK
ncbi:hypothetical protein ERX46_00625 [Brumimicrobium glaciale]|uniref:Outer membrane protein beta-barrel domain-containing protein n=1 Tax=Brumimicrobium glaciale TaxID=200475 RepID=A0A4Q4KPZ5_9FLAO|nr:hypothetical protein [Brumimicrobium glaciale]RYM35526.1 hypothetical protein ERX46_00625 [Brumimicrobium glaciale]